MSHLLRRLRSAVAVAALCASLGNAAKAQDRSEPAPPPSGSTSEFARSLVSAEGRCDRLAARDADDDASSPTTRGVAQGAINTTEAVPACEAAVAADPTSRAITTNSVEPCSPNATTVPPAVPSRRQPTSATPRPCWRSQTCIATAAAAPHDSLPAFRLAERAAATGDPAP